MTVKDMLGKDVTIKAQPQRIVAASPSAIELLYAAGGKAVARTTTARTPAEVASLPDVGTAERPAGRDRVAHRHPTFSTNRSSTRLSPAFSNDTSSLSSSAAVTMP